MASSLFSDEVEKESEKIEEEEEESSCFHPNGILPEGNLILSSTNNNNPHKRTVRQKGLGDFSSFTDSLFLDFISYFDANTLIISLSLVSKIFYLFIDSDFLWRDFVLLKTKGRGIQFHKTWKMTYARLIWSQHHHHLVMIEQLVDLHQVDRKSIFSCL